MKKKITLKNILIVLVVLIVVAQLVPVTRDNPPVQADFNDNAAVKLVLKKSCYDCHSNESVWPWYSNIAPVSWLVASDVHEARQKLNFSNWGLMTAARLKHAPDNMWDEVNEGGMPLPQYLLIHTDAKLTDADKAVIRAWAEGTAPAGTTGDTTKPVEPEEESE